MRIGAVVTLAVVAGAQTNRSSDPASNDAAKKQVAEVEQRWIEALNHADVQTVDSLLDEDFVRPSPEGGGFITKAKLLSFLRSHLSAQNHIRAEACKR